MKGPKPPVMHLSDAERQGLEKLTESPCAEWLRRPSGRLAGGQIPRLQTVLQRLLTLRGRSVGPRLGRDVALRLALDAVVAYSSCGVQALGDLRIRQLRQVAGFGGVVRPDAGQAVSLEFSLN